MKRKIIPVLIGCTLSFSALAAQPTAERYVVSFPEGTHVNYAGAFASAFPNGLPVGIGSGLLFTGKQGDALTFATITDRGPNADSPKEGKNETKIFVTPDFAPLLMTIRVQNGKPKNHVPRFQIIAASSMEKTIARPWVDPIFSNKSVGNIWTMA